MKITKVSAEYKELRSARDMSYSNLTYCIGYEAEVQEGESAETVRRQLMEMAMRDVKILHGD